MSTVVDKQAAPRQRHISSTSIAHDPRSVRSIGSVSRNVNPRVRTRATPITRYFPDTDGLVYCSDMKKHYGDAEPISDLNPTGSRVPSTNLILSWNGSTLRAGKAKNFAYPSGARDGTLGGGIVAGGVSGVRGKATAADGVDDKIEFTLPDDHTSDFTVALWVKANSLVAWSEVLSKGSGLEVALQSGTNKLYFQMDSGTGGAVVMNTAITAGVFYFIALTVKGLVGTAYLNGSVDGAGTYVQRSSLQAVLKLANLGTVYGPYTYGDLWYFGEALSKTAIRQLYEDSLGWIENKANPHCVDIDDAHPLGSDRASVTGCVLSIDMETQTADGKLRDFSGAGNHATISGPKYARGTIKNGSYVFTGSPQIISVPSSPSLEIANDLTLIAVVKPTVAAEGGIIHRAVSSTGFTLNLSAAQKPYVFIGDGVGSNSSLANSTIPLNAVSILAVTIEKISDTQSRVTFYINGIQDVQRTVNRVLASAVAGTSLIIGRDVLFTGLYYTGVMGQIGVFNNVQSADQIAKLTQDMQKMLGLCYGAPPNVLGQVGSALEFNGNSQYVEVQDCPALAFPQVTFGAWANLDGFTGYPTIISKKGASGASFKLYGNQTAPYNLIGYYSDGTSKTATGGAMAANRWSLAAAIYNGANLITYLDGVASAPTAFVASASSNASPLRIGMEYNAGYPADGRIAMPFFFNKAKSAEWIRKFHNNTRRKATW